MVGGLDEQVEAEGVLKVLVHDAVSHQVDLLKGIE